jgi:hypothetical protein
MKTERINAPRIGFYGGAGGDQGFEIRGIYKFRIIFNPAPAMIDPTINTKNGLQK